METAELRRRFASSPVAHLSTVRPDGAPHIVPIVFAVVDDTVYSAVDAKPKRSSDLQRLTNINADPRCALLVDPYEDDWRRLWWVRADGNGEIVEEPPTDHPGIQALVQRFPQYSDDPPSGPLLVVTIHRWTGWTSTPDGRRTRWRSASASQQRPRHDGPEAVGVGPSRRGRWLLHPGDDRPGRLPEL